MGRLERLGTRWRRSLAAVGSARILCILAGICLTLGLVTSPAGASVASSAGASVAGHRSAAGAAAGGSGSVIVSAPAEGSTVDGPVWVVLRDTDGAVSLEVNQQSQVLPPPSTDGLVSILIGPGQGLQPGANALRVSDSDGAGSVVTRRFTVSRAVPVAGAADETVAAGDTVVLDASASWGMAGGGPLEYRWKLVSAPPGDSVPRSAAVPRLDLKAGRDGDVVYSLTVSERAGAGGNAAGSGAAWGDVSSRADLVTVTAVPPAPMVPIDTQAAGTAGSNAIKVGSVSYPAPASANGQAPAAQVLAFDRATLEFKSDVTVGCDVPDQACAGRIGAALAADAGLLVIAAVHPGYPQSAVTLRAFQDIGASASPAPTSDGSYSVVGVPGVGVGNGQETGPYVGSLTGQLTPDTAGNYSYVAAASVDFDTRAPGSTATTNVIEVGDKRYTGTLPARSAGGFHLVIVNRQTLRLKVQGTYGTAGAPDEAAALDDLVSVLKTEAGPAFLVFLSSVGTTSSAWDGPTPTNFGLQLLGEAVQALGGTVNTVVRLRTGDNYSLVGYRGLGPAQGIEASGLLSSNEQAGRIQGVLTPDSSDYWVPTVSSFAPEASFALQSIVDQPASAWPLTGTAGDRAAVAYISAQALGSDGDLRTAYWLNDTWTSARWEDVARKIDKLTFPPGQTAFTPAEFEAARSELDQEISWVIVVQGYFERLAEPYANSGLMSYTSLIDMQNKISASVAPPPNNTATLNWLGSYGEVAGLVPLIGGFSDYGNAFRVLSVLVLSFKSGVSFYKTASGSPLTPANLRTKADALATTFAETLEKGRAGMFREEAVILGDYAKLKAVGTQANCDRSGSNCPPEWQVSQSSLSFGTTNLVIQARQSFAAALLPLKFQAHLLTGTNRLLLAQDYICETKQAFGSEPTLAQYSYASYDSTYTIQYNRILALAEEGKNGTLLTPSAPFFSTLFDPVNFNDPTSTPLGLIRPQFYLQNFPDPVTQTCRIATADHDGKPAYTSIAAQTGGNPVTGALWIQRDDTFRDSRTGADYPRGVTLFDGTPPDGIADLPGAVVADPTSSGHWVVTTNGDILAFGKADHFTCTRLSQCSNYKNTVITAAAATPNGKGLWVLGLNGQVWTVGDARALGDTTRQKQHAEGIAASPTGEGYTIVLADGGVYTFGNAQFFGSTGGRKPGGDATGIALSIGADGKVDGYWMVSQNGGVFAFGAAPFYGSTGGDNGGSTVVGITALPHREGYVIVHLNGAINEFLRK